MKKKFLFVLLIVFVVCLSLTLFSACDNGNKIDSSGAGGSISDASGNSSGTTAYSINFVADGSIYAKISTKGNEIVNLPANPEKVGYVFDGWYFDNEVWEKPFTANSLLDTSLSIDMYVYAKSMPITYNIKYELNGGENNSANPTTYTIESEKIVLQTPSKTGYDFVGWYADEELTEKVEKISTGSSGDRKFYAKWIPVYAIEYELNGGVNNSANPTTYTIESEDIVLQNPSKTDYDFVGWYSDEDLTEKVEKIASSSCGNKKFYAKWSSKYYLFDTYNKTIIGVTDYAKTCSSLVIPEQINGIDVSGIGNSAFSNCSKLNSVTIPDSVTSIGNSAFSGCAGLTSVYYAGDIASWCGISGLENIMSGSRTLYIGGKKVEGELIIPNSVTSICDSAFSYCKGVTSVTIPNSVTSIGYSAFDICTGLRSVTIGNSVTNIGNDAFSGCVELKTIYYTGDIASWCKISGLSNIMSRSPTLYIDGKKVEGELVIPDDVTSIGHSAFRGCAKLTSVTIPDSVMSISGSAFEGCAGLTSVYYTGDIASWCGISGLENIMSGSRTLYIGSKKVEGELVIPDGVTSIGGYAFYGCTGLISVTIGNSVTSIGDSAFENCISLTSVTIPDSVTSIGYSVFYQCWELKTIYYTGDITSWCRISGLDEIMSSSRTLYIGGKKVEAELIIPDGVTSIGDSAFEGCMSLTSVTIGNSVTSIGASAFSNCVELKTIYYTGDIASWCRITGLKNIMSSSRTLYIGSKKVEGDLVIPDGVTSIGNSAFRGCKGLTSVIIGNSVTSISDSAFRGCAKLTSMAIPDSVTSIGNYAFSGCEELKTIYYTGDIASWCRISGLNSIMSSSRTLHIGGKKVEGELVIPDGVTSIESNAFKGCTGLTSVVIPDSVTKIGGAAFDDCTGLTSMVIPDSVTKIGAYAFSGCTELKTIYYKGSKEQWNNIEKGSNWDSGAGNPYESTGCITIVYNA